MPPAVSFLLTEKGCIVELHLFFRLYTCRGRCLHRPASIHCLTVIQDVSGNFLGGCGHPPLQDAAKSGVQADSVVRPYRVHI